MGSNKELFKESGWWDKKPKISLDKAFKDDSDAGIINCSDIKKKPIPRPLELKKTEEKSINLLAVHLQEIQQARREHIAIWSVESGRTLEWYETRDEYKNNHSKCEYCDEYSDLLECHDITPYRFLTVDQTHNRDFLKQKNFVLLCHEHHHNVAHLGDPDWRKSDPGIREICEQKKRERHAKTQEDQKRWREEHKEELERLREEAERNAKNWEDIRSYVKNMPGNKRFVEKMILPGNKRRP